MDRGTARSFVALKAEDPSQTINTPAQYNDAIDLSEEQFAIETKSLMKVTTLTVVSAQNYIALPSDFMVSILARHKGLKLKPTSRFDLAFQRSSDWGEDNGTPIEFYIDEENERIIFHPKPQAADAGANLELIYAAIPTNITDDATVLMNAKAFLAYYHPGIVAWAAYWVLGYRTQTPEIIAKRRSCIDESTYYKDKAIEIYKNMQDQPVQMKGGRSWQDKTGANKENAFTDN